MFGNQTALDAILAGERQLGSIQPFHIKKAQTDCRSPGPELLT
jgi:hypothetical protein